MSLWDVMINFSLGDFASMLTHVSQDHELTGIRIGEVGNTLPTGADLDRVLKTLQFAANICAKQNFEGAKKCLVRIHNRHQVDELTWGHLRAELWRLYETLEDDSKEHYFYHYPTQKAALLNSARPDWAATLTAFPRAEKDILAAVDCYALGHDHASIYHCMMVLERGLPSLARRIRVTFEKARPTWGDMIRDIRNAIDTRRTALHSPPRGAPRLSPQATKRERDLLDAAGEAATEFKFFEHTWRNHIAHGRASYDATDAKKALDHVQLFMQVIATKLKLKEKR
jgi:hypothetical protein